MNQPSAKPVRLTSLSHGGGCGCKIAPGVLAEILKGTSGLAVPKACDPQTSGGLLVSCAPEAAAEVLGIFKSDGFASAAVIGAVSAGPAQLSVRT